MKENYVFLVDDEFEMRHLFLALLQDMADEKNFQIKAFDTGLSCLEFLRNEISNIEVLLVFSDINMPLMNGFEFLEKVKDQFPRLKVVMISAHADHGARAKAAKLGARRFLEKPLDFDHVVREIEDSLAKNA